MKLYLKLAMFSLAVTAFLGTFAVAHAAMPILSLSSQNATNTITISVTGDGNSTVNLYYNTSNGTQVKALGTTNYYGSFSVMVNAVDYPVTTGSSAYVIVNGQQSSSVLWPTSSSSGLSLSQTSINTTVGQYTTVTVYNNSLSLLVSSNSNSSVATATVNGNSISIYGMTNGTSVITICTSNISVCAAISVTVGSGSSGSFYLSQTSLSVNVGQTSLVTAYNSGNTLISVSSNSNSSIATATVTGNTISVYGQQVGSTSMTICQTSYPSSCSVLYVTVNYNGSTGNNSNFTLTSLTIPAGGSAIVSSANPIVGTTPITSSNPSVATASVSYLIVGCTGSTMYSMVTGQLCSLSNNSSSSSIIISALSPGTTTLSLCPTYGVAGCYQNINVTVTGSGIIVNPPVINNPIGFNTSCTFFNTLYRGMSGDNVYCLQLRLYGKGYLDAHSLKANFDDTTDRAVRSFQSANGLFADGVVGTGTRARLFQ